MRTEGQNRTLNNTKKRQSVKVCRKPRSCRVREVYGKFIDNCQNMEENKMSFSKKTD